jgi:hypothetical protein
VTEHARQVGEGLNVEAWAATRTRATHKRLFRLAHRVHRTMARFDAEGGVLKRKA